MKHYWKYMVRSENESHSELEEWPDWADIHFWCSCGFDKFYYDGPIPSDYLDEYWWIHRVDGEHKAFAVEKEKENG